MRISALLAVIAALTVTAADAKEVKRGQYTLAGSQGICVKNDGTWYGTTFSGWAGRWIYSAANNTTHFYGNYEGGDGNDVWTVRRKNVNWTEWRDDLSYEIVIPNTTFVRTNRRCDAAPMAVAEGGSANPAEAAD